MKPRRRALILRGPVACGAFCLFLGIAMITSGQGIIVVIGVLLGLGGLAMALNLPKMQAERTQQERQEKEMLRSSGSWPTDDLELAFLITMFATRYGIEETTAILRQSTAKHRAIAALRLANASGILREAEQKYARGRHVAEGLLNELAPRTTALGLVIEATLAEKEKLPEDRQDLYIPSTWSLDNPRTWPPDPVAAACLVRYAIKNGVEATATSLYRAGVQGNAIRALRAEDLRNTSLTSVQDLEAKYGSVVEPLLARLLTQ